MANSIAAFREAKRKQEEEELRKKLEGRRKKMEEQKTLLEQEEKKERELRESRKKMSVADIEKQRKAELQAMAAKLEEERKKALVEEIKRQEELEKKREAEKEAAMKAEVAALMNSGKKVNEIVTSPQKKALLSPRGKPGDPHKPLSPRGAKPEAKPTEEPKKAPRPVKQITDEERARRLEKLNSEGAMRAAEAKKATEAPAERSKMLKRAETMLFRQPALLKKPAAIDDRKMKDVPKPISTRLDEGMIFDLKGIPNPDMLKIHFLKEGRITIGAAKRLIGTIKEQSAKLPNILELQAPMVIVGDIHGQFYDLINMMRKSGAPKDQPYLFLGDYVDRGMFNTEVVFYLFACKLAYPKNVFLLRGNHEGRQMTNHYNFRRECVKKYSEEIYQDMMKCFDTFPICSVVSGQYGKFFCTHGGLSPFIHTLEDISNLDRFQDVPTSGAYCDLLWSDPVEEKTFEDWQVYDLNRYRKIDFDSNPGRNLSFTYGYKFAKEFCEENNFVSIVRGHEVQKEGFMRHWFGKEDRKDPLVMTVFSAPNYTDTHGNKGAYLSYPGPSYTVETFDHEPHPFVLPNFQDGVSFSLPFIAEHSTPLSWTAATKIFAQLVAMMSEEDEDGNDEIQQSIKKKLNFLLRTVAGYKLERIERESELKEATAPVGADASYEEVTKADAKNEKAPSEIAAPKPATQNLRAMQMKRSTSTGAIKKFF